MGFTSLEAERALQACTALFAAPSLSSSLTSADGRCWGKPGAVGVSWHCPADSCAAEGISVSTRLHRSTGRLQCLRRTPQFLLSGAHPTLRV